MTARHAFQIPFPFVAVALFLAVGASASAQTDWTLRASGTMAPLSGAAFGNDRWVLVGEGGTILTSTGGAAWAPVSSGTTLHLRAVVWGDQEFCAVGQAGTILTSPDGLAWTPRASGVSAGVFLSGVAYSGGRYVAVGGSGTIVTSADAIAWSPAVSGTFRFLQTVTAGGNGFVAAGFFGTIVRSADGLVWSSVLSGTTSAIFSGTAWFGGKYYAVGGNGVILASATGQTWTPKSSGTFAFLRAVGSDGESVVAVGDGGTILVSSDGETWAPRPSGVAVTLSGVGYGDGRYVAVGDPQGLPASGVILTSPTPIPIKEALDGACFAWKTPQGELPWGTQTAVTHDGIDAAVSAPGLSVDQVSVVETSIHGPAILSFSWKLSAGIADSLTLTVDGAPVAAISGEQDWTPASFAIGAGEKILRWTYARGAPEVQGQNLAWLDEVSAAYTYGAWAAAHFDASEVADPALGGPEADPDGDDLENLAEYYFDTDPRSASGIMGQPPEFEILPTGPHVSFTYRRHGKRLDGITARIEAATDLWIWEPQTATEEVLSTVGAVEVVRLTATEVFGLAGRKFYRLSLVTQP